MSIVRSSNHTRQEGGEAPGHQDFEQSLANRFALASLSTEQIVERLREEPVIQEIVSEKGAYKSYLWGAGRKARKRAEGISETLLEQAREAKLIPDQPVIETHSPDLSRVSTNIYRVVGFKSYLGDHPYQDAASVIRGRDSKYIVATSADGSGGVPLADYGAELLSRIGSEVATKLLDRGYQPETAEFMGRYYQGLYEQSHKLCRQVGISPEDAGNTFLSATTFTTIIENRGVEVRTSHISLSDGAFLFGRDWRLIDKLPEGQYPDQIKRAVSAGINYPNMIITGLAHDLGQKAPLEDRLRSGAGDALADEVLSLSQAAVLVEQKSGEHILVGGVANGSDGIAHTLGENDFPLLQLMRNGADPETVRKLALLHNTAVTLEGSSVPADKILLAKLHTLDELIHDFRNAPELRGLLKAAQGFLGASLALAKKNFQVEHKFGAPVDVNLEEAISIVRSAGQSNDQQRKNAVVEAFRPLLAQLSRSSQEVLHSVNEFSKINFSEAKPTFDDIVVIFLDAPVPEMLGSSMPEAEGDTEIQERNRKISERINNFVNFLPGGYQRDERYMEALADPQRMQTPLARWLDDSGREGQRTPYSEKRLAQTGREYFDEIDGVCRELGLDLEVVARETQQYRALRGRGESAHFLSEIAEPVFNAMLLQGYNEYDLRT